MTKVYRVQDGAVIPMEEARCRDESRELQDLLERSPDHLLAGEQIDPEHPRRWLLIKREMEVPDPVSGAARWSIDFLFVDQDAVLTFVECKRHDDTRSRREVIAQVLDYAANAPRLWRSEDLRRAAEITQQKHGLVLEEVVNRLNKTESEKPDLFDRAIANLAEHKLRIVLFLEAAPPELKTLVEFLVKELSTVQIVLIEAKRYRSDGLEVVAPTVWGYTEQVRQRRQLLEEALSGGRRLWDQDSFFAELAERVPDEAGQRAVQVLFRELPKAGYNLTWGTGASGSLNVRRPGVTERAIATITAEGDLVVNYGSLGNTPAEISFRDHLAAALEVDLGKAKPHGYPNSYPRIKNAEWAPRSNAVVTVFQNLASSANVSR
jgi:hypothetical protein